MEVREVPADHARVRVRERAQPPALEEAETVQEIGPVAPDRVRRGSPLGREIPEERGHRRAALRAAGRLHALSVSRR